MNALFQLPTIDQRQLPLMGSGSIGPSFIGFWTKDSFTSVSLLSNNVVGSNNASSLGSSGLATPTLSSSSSSVTSESNDTSSTASLESGPQRYAAYAMRLRTLITSSSRYIAYTSDIGEAFRPLTRPEVVRAAYGISWIYLIGDVAYAGYKAAKDYEALSESVSSKNIGLVNEFESEAANFANKALLKASHTLPLEKILDHKTLETLSPAEKIELRKRHAERYAQHAKQEGLDTSKVNESTHVGLAIARRAIFQSIASMALPAFTIHSVVRYSAPVFAKSSRPRIRAAGPTIAGLLFVPALPYLFDEPVEHVIDFAFDWIQERLLGSPQSVHRIVEAVKEKMD